MRSMLPRWRLSCLLVAGLVWTSSVSAQLAVESVPAAAPFPGTALLEGNEDLSARMLEGMDKMLQRLAEEAAVDRVRLWKRDFSSGDAYEKAVAPNRERLRRMLGVVNERVPAPRLEVPGAAPVAPKVAETDRFVVYAVRWPVLPGVHGEGLLLEPKTAPVARVVVVPDADQTPEQVCGLVEGLPAEQRVARRLADAGCQVLVPVLVDRSDTWSGSEAIGRFTNQPHREWIYRQAFVLGRHIIGYELEKLMAAADCLQALGGTGNGDHPVPKLGIVGFGEGGLLALYAAALDPRFASALVSGYFGPRQGLWEEPIYRNVFGLLTEFGDAEVASLVAPRRLVVEYSLCPAVNGPPPARENRSGAAPGRIRTPERAVVEDEVDRARNLFPKEFVFPLEFVYGNEGTPTGPGSDSALDRFLAGVGVAAPIGAAVAEGLPDQRTGFDPGDRQKRTVGELVAHLKGLLDRSEREREGFFWDRLVAHRTNDWTAAVKGHRRRLWEDVLGRLPSPTTGAKPRSRTIAEKPKWLGYELVLDVWPDVPAWAYLLVPKDLRAGERRPVVVCQHGLESVPAELVAGVTDSGYDTYKSIAAKLADRGFVVLVPHAPVRGGDTFRVLQRKAHPLRKSLASVVIGQHERLLEWLSQQPFVDARRVGFYGLGYGGRLALQVPAVLDAYTAVVSSGAFGDRVRACVLVDSPFSQLYRPDYEMLEWNLGNTFNDAELVALIAPRPFMVERGLQDESAPDEWVASEYARVRRLYTRLDWPERADIEYFNGPQTINAVGTVQFLYKNLDWMRR